MKKLLIIGFKDLQLVFRDRAALMFMLLAPFLLTLGMGFVTGRFSGTNNSGIQDIPVVIVNQDQAELGNALVDVFNSGELADLVAPTESDDPQAARQLIDDDQAAAAIIIPEGFTNSIIPTQAVIARVQQGEAFATEVVKIEVYTNPARPTSAGVIKAIVDEFISRIEEGRISGMVSVLSIPDINQMPASQVEALSRQMFSGADNATLTSAAIALKTDQEGSAAVEFDPLAYMAPGMALMFLMYAVSYGGRSILAERAQGTLPRLLVSPTTATQILGGKVLGIYFTGVAQVGILILASALFFQVKWGDPLGMFVLILAAVFGATGWGMLITAVGRTPGQINALGSAIMLIFGILGGSFINLDQMPSYIRAISAITPNAWGLDGFTTLALGGTLTDLTKPIVALLIMGGGLFIVAAVIFQRSNLMRK